MTTPEAAALRHHEPMIRNSDREEFDSIECECGDQRGAETFTDHLVRVLTPLAPEVAPRRDDALYGQTIRSFDGHASIPTPLPAETPFSVAPETFGAHKPHANDPETQVRRVLACVKCGDRHTVDVAEVQREAIEPLLALVRAADVARKIAAKYASYDPVPAEPEHYRLISSVLGSAVSDLPESVRVAARKPE